MKSNLWGRDETKLAFHLYCQLPFGRLNQGNREVIELASLIGRSPSAVAMKLVNQASLDPAITQSGRKGLSNASRLDQEIWAEFNSNWEGLAMECEALRSQRVSSSPSRATDAVIEGDPDHYVGETKQVLKEERLKQHFFRRAVLSSYRGRCCITRLAEPRLLLAGHIVPWHLDEANRLNPRNGICLSALHDKAFDRGLIALTDEFTLLISEDIKKSKDDVVRTTFLPLEGRAIEMPERFVPSQAFVSRHRREIFLDNLAGR
jgi:predicted restriction endonuclease